MLSHRKFNGYLWRGFAQYFPFLSVSVGLGQHIDYKGVFLFKTVNGGRCTRRHDAVPGSTAIAKFRANRALC